MVGMNGVVRMNSQAEPNQKLFIDFRFASNGVSESRIERMVFSGSANELDIMFQMLRDNAQLLARHSKTIKYEEPPKQEHERVGLWEKP